MVINLVERGHLQGSRVSVYLRSQRLVRCASAGLSPPLKKEGLAPRRKVQSMPPARELPSSRGRSDDPGRKRLWVVAWYNSRCRLFLSLRSRIHKVLDCSPSNRERELGLPNKPNSHRPLAEAARLLRAVGRGGEDLWLDHVQWRSPNCSGTPCQAFSTTYRPKGDKETRIPPWPLL